jgi:hypothetical protein
VGGFWFSCVAGANLNLLLPMRWFMTGAVLLVWWVLFLRYGSLLVLAIDGWIITILYFKARLTKSLPEMLRLIKLSRHGPTATLLFAITLSGAAVSVLVGLGSTSLFLASFVWFVPIMTLCGLSHALMPPSVLCLSSSREDAIWIQERIATSCFPHRVVSLYRLDPLNERNPSNIEADIFRTRDDSQWRSAVRTLLKIAPVLVIDTRLDTSALREEIACVFESKLDYKAILILSVEGEVLGLQGLHESKRNAACLHVTSVEGFIWYITGYRRLQPTLEKPMASLHQEYSETVFLAGCQTSSWPGYLDSQFRR